MANTTITNLPTVTALSGSEPLLGVQAGSSVQITTGQIASLAVGQSGFPFSVAIGGTGNTAFTANGILFGNGASPLGVTAAGTTGQVLVGTTGGAPTWSSTIPSTAGVTSLSLGTTGLTPTAATTGAVTVGFGSTPTAAGIYSPAANQIALSTASTARLLIDASGNVGVGVTPAVLLDVGGQGTPQIRALSTTNAVDTRLLSLGASSAGIVGTYSNHPILFYTNGTERMRIQAGGIVTINANITGGTTSGNFYIIGQTQSGVTTRAYGVSSSIYSAAASFTTASVAHFWANPFIGGAGSTITSQYGFLAENTLATQGAATVTNAFGFYSNIDSAANRWNFFANGTANNAFNGNVRIGSTAAPTVALDVTGAALISTTLGVTTSVTAPLIIGGTGAASSLTLQSTSGAGTTDSILFRTGNNGAVTALTIASNGNATFLSTSTTAIGTLSLTNDLTVPNGGTGVGTFTANGVLFGNAAGAIQVTAQGGANTILVANAGAPSFSATPTIGTSVTVPLVIGGTAAGSTLTLRSTSGVGTTDSVVIQTGNNGAVTAATFNTTGVATSRNWYNTATQTATNTATLTAAQITGPFLLGTPTATASYTLPLASDVETALGTPPNETGWEFVVFTTAAFAITLLTNTGWTLVGSMATGATANSFARFRARKTALNTFTLYRIS